MSSRPHRCWRDDSGPTCVEDLRCGKPALMLAHAWITLLASYISCRGNFTQGSNCEENGAKYEDGSGEKRYTAAAGRHSFLSSSLAPAPNQCYIARQRCGRLIVRVETFRTPLMPQCCPYTIDIKLIILWVYEAKSFVFVYIQLVFKRLHNCLSDLEQLKGGWV